MNPNDNTNPQSRIWLCKTNLENDYKNTLTFSSATTQRNYFIGNPNTPNDTGTATKSYTDFTYLRLERWIKVPDFIEDIDTNNYLVLINKNKYYYYFITSMEYIDSQTTRINIELDVMQTYFFDITYKQTFIEREHVTDDVAGKHTIPEGLETGDFIINNSGYFGSHWDRTGFTFGIVIGLTNHQDNIPFEYGGIFSGLHYYYFPDPASAMYIVNNEDVKIVYMYPASLTTPGQEIPFGPNLEYRYVILDNTTSAGSVTETILNSKPTSINGYTPRNKKLLTGEYNYLLCTDGVGSAKIYNYEYFSGTNVQFKEYSCMTPGGSISHVPMNYKGSSENITESFSNAKFPICSFESDSYTNWLTQQGVNTTADYIGKEVIESGAMMLGGLLIPGLAPVTGATALMNIIGAVKQVNQAKRVPDGIKGNVNSGDVAWGMNHCKSMYYQMSIKEEFAKSIDKFFDQFGYKVNTLKSPNIHTRTNWNYLKTQNCNFTGNIPQQYMDKIKNIFDNGITFWHNPSTMYDYSQTNSVIS